MLVDTAMSAPPQRHEQETWEPGCLGQAISAYECTVQYGRPFEKGSEMLRAQRFDDTRAILTSQDPQL
jgi:hypothetical protein